MRISGLAVTPRLTSLRGVGFQQGACVQELASGGFVLLDQRVERVTLLATEP